MCHYLLHHPGQGRDGGLGKQLPRGDVETLTAGLGNHPNGEDGVTTQSKEVIVDPHLLQMQHLRPDLRQDGFHLGLRCHIHRLQSLPAPFRSGQCGAIQLAIRC